MNCSQTRLTLQCAWSDADGATKPPDARVLPKRLDLPAVQSAGACPATTSAVDGDNRKHPAASGATRAGNEHRALALIHSRQPGRSPGKLELEAAVFTCLASAVSCRYGCSSPNRPDAAGWNICRRFQLERGRVRDAVWSLIESSEGKEANPVPSRLISGTRLVVKGEE